MTNDGKWNGFVEAPALTGDAVISLTEDAIVFERAGKSLVLSFSSIDAFSVQNFRLLINAETCSVQISRMGRDTEALYEKLWEAYNARTLKAFFVEGAPMFASSGEYRYEDEAGKSVGVAKILLFENCLCILPPSSAGRRVPFCFMAPPELVAFSIRMKLDTGETYEVIRLGDHTKRLYELINQNLMKIHETAIETVRTLDGALDAGKASNLAWLVPDGAAACIRALDTLAPSFVTALEARIAESRAAETYQYFRAICPPENVCAGLKTGLSWTEEAADIVWVTAIREKAGGGVAAVELALGEEDSAATYIYKFTGDQGRFFIRLNHAMEAVSFHREVISMSDEELKLGKNDLYYMAVKRTGSLKFLRACFAGRAIHRTPESWKKSIDDWMK